jgi:hypothetical protein
MKLIKETEEWITYDSDRNDEDELNENYFADNYKGNFRGSSRYISNHTIKEKEYKNDLLIKEYESNSLSNDNDPWNKVPIERKRTINYDNQFRVIDEMESLKYDDGNFESLNVYSIDYKYNNESYVKTKRKIVSGFLPCYVEGENIVNPGDRLQKTDEIDSILEVRIVDSKKLWEKFTSISEGKFQITKYHYDDEINSWDYGELYKITGQHKVENFDCILTTYNNNIITHYIDSETICLQFKHGNGSYERLELTDEYKYRKIKDYKKTIYKDGLITEINYIYLNYKYLDKEETVGLVIKELFEYDSSNKLICQKYYSLNKGELFLFKQRFFEYREFEKTLKDKNPEIVAEKCILPLRTITKMHISRNREESISMFKKDYFFTNKKIELGDIEDDFQVTNSIYNLYNSESKIVGVREFDCKKLVRVENYRYDEKFNCIYKESYDVYESGSKGSLEYEIYEYDEFNNLISQINRYISENIIGSETIKRFYYED